MRFSEQWLREWVDPAVDTRTLADQLTMAGLEVEAIEPAAPAIEGVVVARIVETRPHPEADRLQVCEVDDGRGRLTIVCGAANARPGILVPLARVGATLPGGLAIKEARLRGVASFGMLCSAAELGLAEQAEGLLELPSELAPGMDIVEALALDDACIEVALTPNRGDCLSIAGIAREVATLNRLAVTPSSFEAAPIRHELTRAIEIEDTEACPLYAGRIITGIDPESVSPLWLQERLRRSGLRSLGPVVDVTNLVMLELGQPMHAFDLDRLEGSIRVRRSREGEALTLLDGREVDLRPGSLLIADEAAPLALAGIMGGQASAVSASTRAVFLEAAHFRPGAIAGQARAYGLHTDSAHRFERGVDATLPERAIERATALLLEIVGGEAGPLTVAAVDRGAEEVAAIPLERDSIARLLGVAIDDEEVTETLGRLGMTVDEAADGWRVRPPSFRFDIAREVDLIEEIARIHGYDRLPDNRPVVAAGLLPVPDAGMRLRGWLRQALADRGYFEAISYSFVDPEWQHRLDPGQTPLALANPLANDLAVMRTSLWPGLIAALRRNLSRQQERVRLFEIGRRFTPPLEAHEEPLALACVVAGPVHPRQWGEAERPVDFYDLKGDLEETLGRCGRLRFVADRHPALHPGRTARITDDAGRPLGWIGALHPAQAEALDIEGEVLLCEVALDGFVLDRPARFTPVSRFPVVQRDIAVLVDEGVAADDLLATVRRAAGDVLADVRLFDVYQGEGVEPGFKSLAIHLTFQDVSRTLTADESDRLVKEILATLTDQYHARLRD